MPLLGCLGVLGLETDLGSDGVRCWPLSGRVVFKGGENAAEPCFDDLGLVAKSSAAIQCDICSEIINFYLT